MTKIKAENQKTLTFDFQNIKKMLVKIKMK